MISFEVSRPLFVRDRHYPIVYKSHKYSYQKHFPWQEVGMPEEHVRLLFNLGRVYHNEELEVQTKVGDRLSELSGERLKKLIRLTNAFVKKRCTTDKEFQSKKIKGSLIEDKQRALVRSWIHRNEWALEEYYRVRDDILESKETEDEIKAQETPKET